MSGRLLLITGGARSGKSRYAVQRASALCEPVLVLATGVPTDDEMAARIARHRADRPPEWTALEARYGLAAALESSSSEVRCVLLEDLPSLVSNLLIERSAGESAVEDEARALISLCRRRSLDLVAVSQEVGSGLVPSTPLGRQFRDLLGLMNQLLAAEFDEVVLMVAGLPLRLKP